MFSMTRRADLLIEALIQHEGWVPPSAGNNYMGSRSFRNHNPGNLRSSPFSIASVGGFCVFRTDQVGLMALHWDLLQKAKGNTRTNLSGKSTIRDLITVYAPSSDGNNVEAYIKEVVAVSGLPESTTLADIFGL